MLASRIHWRLLVGTILALMALAWIGPSVVPAPAIQENRFLAKAPAWPTRLEDVRAYRKAADAYVADHFPARPHLIGALNRLRMMAGVSGSNRVIVGRDGWLFFDDNTHLGSARADPPMSGPEVRNWLLTLAGRTEMLKARGVPYVVVAAPVKETVYPQFGPRWYPGPSRDRPAILLPRLARGAGVGEIDYLHPALAAATRGGWRTFSRHDTHWNGYGAYAGYAGLMNRLHALGITDGPRPLSDFTIAAGRPRSGPRDLALMLGVSSFVHLDFPHIRNIPGESRVDISYLTAKRDWTGAQVIDTGQVGKPILLMTRDSFSNEIQSLLYPHFSRLILAHNQDGFWRQDLIDRFKPDVVILEVIEPGLRVGMGGGPPASAEAAARIDRTLATPGTPGAPAPLLPSLAPPDAATAGALAVARSTDNCHLETAALTSGAGGAATLTVSGWLSELGTKVTSPQGLVALKGAGGVFAGPLRLDKPRPDVAAYYRNPTGRESGFVGSFFVARLPKGDYTPVILRRAGAGWIACVGKQPLFAP